MQRVLLCHVVPYSVPLESGFAADVESWNLDLVMWQGRSCSERILATLGCLIRAPSVARECFAGSGPFQMAAKHALDGKAI